MTIAKQRAIGSFDWDLAKRRLEQLADSLACGEQLSAEQGRALMDHRAQVLAQPPDIAPARDEVIEVLALRLAGERLAVETRFVREVFCAAAITPVPGAPGHLLGVTNLRGTVLAVMDFHQLLGLGKASVDDQPRLVVFGQQRAEFGVPGDEIVEVASLRIAEILPPPALSGAFGEFARGVTKDGLVVLDGEVMLADERLFVEDPIS